ncbi:MAG TPA: MMPL family transporter [Thermoguttaceae bacterium]|nr:MMPL family transporter [Thermoguttaceae bacterium]
MTAERTPQAEPSLLARPLGWLTRLVLRYPIPTIALAVGAAVIALAISGARLGFRTSRLDLLSSDCSYNRLWIQYIEEFGDEDDVVIVVEGAGREQVVPVLEEISTALGHQDRLFHAVLHEVDLSKIRAKGLHYVESDRLLKIEQFLEEVEPIVGGDWARLRVGNMVAGTCARLQSGDAHQAEAAREELDRLSGSLVAEVGDHGRYQSPWSAMPSAVATLSELSSKYLLTNEGRLGFVLLRLAQTGQDSFARGSEAIDALRGLIAGIQDENSDRYPELKIGLTGLPVMENDEMRTSQVSMMEASVLSLVGVACLFVAGFGGVRHPLMTVASLLLAMAWSFGYITIAVGHLNILSIAFGVVLIGLGIDFGVHYVARYLQLHATIRSSEACLVQTAQGVGPGILTGAVTTSIAFFAAGLTEFTGVAELGVITGGGILLCLLAALTVLPAMIHLSDQRRSHQMLPVPLDVHGWLSPLFRRPAVLLGATLAVTLVVSGGMSRLWYDHNLLNLQPEGLESVELEKKLLNESNESVWFALSIAESPDDLRDRKARFEQLPSVERVRSIAEFFPIDNRHKRPVIEHLHARLVGLPEAPATVPVDRAADLGLILGQAQALLATGEQTTQVQRIGWQLEQVRRALRVMPETECFRRLSDYQQQIAGDLLNRLHTLRAMANPEPPKLTDLPEGLVTRFVSKNHRYLLKIYAEGDIWDMDAMEKFVREVRSVDPEATGNPLQTYEASRQMKRSYEQAAWYALAAILAVLYIDFRSLRPMLLAMTPVGLGMLQLFGLLGLLNIPLNPANMIVLPLILGIGIDDGVHVVHDFRRQKGRYRMSNSTAGAVLITSLTTMVGFGSLMIASHRGLQSLGRVLTLGVSCCLFTSLVMLPALLTWLRRNATETDEEQPADERERSQAGGITPGKIYRRDSAHPPGTGTHTLPKVGVHQEHIWRDR